VIDALLIVARKLRLITHMIVLVNINEWTANTNLRLIAAIIAIHSTIAQVRFVNTFAIRACELIC
jgi:hypothetical protein